MRRLGEKFKKNKGINTFFAIEECIQIKQVIRRPSEHDSGVIDHYNF